MMTKFVAYYRVSTAEQGKSGLGLEAQRISVETYVNSVKGELIESFTDIESGSVNDREQLDKAIRTASANGATLVVKRLDRLSRGGFTVMSKLESLNIPYIESDSPYDNSLIKEIKFSFAKEERSKISERTSSALSVIKAQIAQTGSYKTRSGRLITSLGTPQDMELARSRSIEVRRQKALSDPNNIRAYAMIQLLKDQGKSWNYIANFLNQSNFTTSRGNKFSDVQVKKLYNLYPTNE